MIPLSVPNFEGNEEKYVLDAVHQGWVSTAGSYVNRFEERLADYLNAPQAVVCQSGTGALHLSLIEAGVGQGDMVIVPTLTFIAAVNPVRYMLAEPVFMDCDDSLCMDTVKLERFCTEECDMNGNVLIHKKTGRTVRAIVVVHVFGNLADMEGIMQVADRFKLKVIEDATEALGSKYIKGKYAGKMAGTIGDYGAFSFNGNKIITTGGGGAVVARNEQSIKHIKYLSAQAKDDELFYVHNEIGYNYRMTNVQAAIGVAQLELLSEFIGRKKRNYDLYKKLLANAEGMGLMQFREGTDSNKWFYAVELNLCDSNAASAKLRSIIEKLRQDGIQTRPIWGLIHKQLPYRECVFYNIERAQYYSDRVINIPCSTNLTEDDIGEVVAALKKVSI
ncbi:MAG: LegC family aminotransferase [Lachnospiraceae bacterium]|nr:LegC family aminotransferase [Lachnospiraceae bacterium]